MPNRFTVEKRGYSISEVDDYIDSMEAVIKSYKDKDAAIKNAILSAQIAADNIITSARNRSVIIKEQSVKKVEEIIGSVNAQRQRVAVFQQEYDALMRKYLREFDSKDFIEINEKIDGLEKFLNRFTIEDEAQDNGQPPEAQA